MIVRRTPRDLDRCEKKYGEDWKRYTERVSWLYLPFVSIPFDGRAGELMKSRILRGLAGLLAIAGLLGGVVVYRTLFFPPKPDPQPLHEDLLALDSPAGQAALTRSGKADYDVLMPELQTQERPAWCGPASIATVVSALKDPNISQTEVFTPEASEVIGPLQVTFMGMTLDQVGGVFSAHARAAVFHAQDDGVEAFRKVVARSADSDLELVVINYLRSEIGQNTSGHISPIGGYDPETDRVLVLDVSSYKYPPVWVRTEALYAAMNTNDFASGLTRGYVVVYP